MSREPLQDIAGVLPLLACPCDGSALSLAEGSLRCAAQGHRFEMDRGIPILLDISPGKSRERGTALFEDTPRYFERLHEKRVNEWKVFPFYAERITGEGPLLDVGSGAGTWAVANARRGMLSVGLEVSRAGCLFAAELARRHGVKNCFFVAGDAARLPFRPKTFGWVTNYTAIEHIHDPERCLAEMARVLSPGGRLVLNTINNFSLRFEKGPRCLPDFLRQALRYGARAFSRGRGAAAFRDPTRVTPEAWVSGQDVDLYEAVSYELLALCRRYAKLRNYMTFSYSASGKDWIFGSNLEPVEQPLPAAKRWAYRLIALCNHVPLLRHMGRTITIVAARHPGEGRGPVTE